MNSLFSTSVAYTHTNTHPEALLKVSHHEKEIWGGLLDQQILLNDYRQQRALNSIAILYAIYRRTDFGILSSLH